MKNSTDTSSEKKLTQSVLTYFKPLQVVSRKSVHNDAPPVNKKRKLSASSEDKQIIKKIASVKEDLLTEGVDISKLCEVQMICEDVIINTDDTVKSKQVVEVVPDDVNLLQCIVDVSKPDLESAEGTRVTSVSNKVCAASKEDIHKQSSDNIVVIDLSDSDSEDEGSNDSSSSHSESCSKTDVDTAADPHHVQSTRKSEEKPNDVPQDKSETPGAAGKSIGIDVVSPQPHRTPKSVPKTPKQIQRKLESAKKKEEKEQARLEKERKKHEEKELKRKEREDREEAKKKEREDKEELRKRERDEKEKKRLAEIEQKNEERRAKEEDRKRKEEQREDERKKKELEKEEAKEKDEIRKKKAAAAFANFFVNKRSKVKTTEQEDNTQPSDITETKKTLNFMPFCVKADMKLAPSVRGVINQERKKQLEDVLLNKTSEKSISPKLYLDLLKEGCVDVHQSPKTWPLSEVKDDVMIVDDGEQGEALIEAAVPHQQIRAKLLSFHENRRPPYWGTWRKSSDRVKARHPFGKDQLLDYEVDSDSDWEEEEPGESLHGSEDEKEKGESEDEYEVDNDFFVPHGYLSDSEHECEEEREPDSPETQKAKLKLLQYEFNAEMCKKTEKIKPRLVGCVWASDDGKPDKCAEAIWRFISEFKMCYDGPITLCATDDVASPTNSPTSINIKSKRKTFPDIFVRDLIRLVHGNVNNRKFLTKEYRAYLRKQYESAENHNNLPDISDGLVFRKIKEIARYMPCPEQDSQGTRCWYVAQSTRDEFQLPTLSVVNNWKYILTPKRQSECGVVINANEPVVETEVKETDNAIMKFTKVLSEAERKKQFAAPVDQKGTSSFMKTNLKENTGPKKRIALLSAPIGVNPKGTNSAAYLPPKKRAALFSVPLGPQIPSITKCNFFKQYQKSGDVVISTDSKFHGKVGKISDEISDFAIGPDTKIVKECEDNGRVKYDAIDNKLLTNKSVHNPDTIDNDDDSVILIE